MPNSFTVFPNVFPGNVTIIGNLTVSGDQVRIGAATPFLRVGKSGTFDADISLNVGFDGVTKDNVAATSWRNLLRTTADELRLQHTNTAGTLDSRASTFAIFTDYTAHSHTGDVTEDTIYTKLIPANMIGANGGWDLLLRVNATSQGASATTLRFKMNGTAIFSFSYTSAFHAFMRLRVRNKNAANSNDVYCTFEIFTGSPANQANLNVNTDYSVDQTLTITVQNALTTDAQTFDALTMQQQNSYGPV